MHPGAVTSGRGSVTFLAIRPMVIPILAKHPQKNQGKKTIPSIILYLRSLVFVDSGRNFLLGKIFDHPYRKRAVTVNPQDLEDVRGSDLEKMFET